MQYKDDMRRLIDIVKQQSFEAPLAQTLDDMKTMANAVKDLSDRLEMHVRKSLTADTKTANKKTSKKKGIEANNKQTTQQQTTPSMPTNSLPTSNSVGASSVSAKDISDMRNDFLQK